MAKPKDGGGPAVLRFKARLVRHPKAAKTGLSITLNVPEVVGKKLGGMTMLEGTINGHPFRAPLDANASGSRSLRVNKAMLNGAGAGVGDTVNLAILGPEPKLTIPADLHAAFAASHTAQASWKDLTPLGRRDWVRWIEAAKTPETRARRVTRTIEQLAEGKRRPCCVNFYEYMLLHVNDNRSPKRRVRA
ncbi:MAG TPA: YdeI/OmpD-associated family protein [Candidatus Cybelea sp.]